MKNLRIRIKKYIFTFPAILFIFIFFISSLGINGSSIGESGKLLLADGEKDPSLIFGETRNLRSDEWAVNTPLILSQYSNQFKQVNSSLGEGQDVSIVSDVPVLDWTLLFKPTNWVYFLGLPPEISFSLRWWLMGYLLIIGVYFFILSLFPKQRNLAITSGILFFFMPFVQWWYQNINLLVIAYTLLIATIIIHLLKNKDGDKSRLLRRRVLLSSTLVYFLIAFALIIYPPYQIPAIYSLFSFLIAFMVHKYPTTWIKRLWGLKYYLLVSFILAISAVTCFIITRSDGLESLSNTSYPAKREVNPGGFPKLHLLNNHLGSLLEDEAKSKQYYSESGLGNSSESSQFTFPILVVIIFSVTSFIRLARERIISIPIIVVSSIMAIYLMRLYIDHFSFIYKPLLLSGIPHSRLILGVGLSTFFMLLITYLEIKKHKLKNLPLITWTTTAITLILYILLYIYTSDKMPFLFNGTGIITTILLITFPSAVLFALLKMRLLIAMAILLASAFFATYNVNPLYKGFGIATRSPLASDIQTVDKNYSGKWVTDINNFWQTESYVLQNGGSTLSGVYIYPQNNLWSKIESADPQAYNRFAHVTFTLQSNNDERTYLKYEGIMQFVINTSPCSDFLKRQNVTKLLTFKPVASRCATLYTEQESGRLHYYIYIINRGF